MKNDTNTWLNLNQRYLSAAVAVLRHRLTEKLLADHETQTKANPTELESIMQDVRREMTSPPALENLCATFGLSAFEREILLLCAGVELDSAMGPLCADLNRDTRKAYVTFSLSLATLTEPHWSALTPAAPLRRWHLIEPESGGPLTLSPLRIDERVLHYLAGVQYFDERLDSFVEDAPSSGSLVPSHMQLAEGIGAAWSKHIWPVPLVLLCGPEADSKRAIALEACQTLRMRLKSASALGLPSSPTELDSFIRLWQRETLLQPAALFLDCEQVEMNDAARRSIIAKVILNVDSPLFVAHRERLPVSGRSVLTIDVARSGPHEQLALWQSVLGAAGLKLNGELEALISQFNLSAPAIHSAAAEILGSRTLATTADSSSVEGLGQRLWDSCRLHARPRLEELAQRIDGSASWTDLVLPPAQSQLLHDLAAHVRQRFRVYEEWGFASKGTRGLGIAALFAGDSGTGKTLAAEVLANELRLDLYRIDVSQLVSKYIGETEKNLRRVFDAAEGSGAILLIDEADALFGKRSEVRDSHDRYANIEVSYLLQRMEAYRGLAILTTNMKKALDTAFLRRIRFVVQFPFPDARLREQIWQRIFPTRTPISGIDASRLARLNVSGGSIRNIALGAAFLAADAKEPVGMAHVLRAARTEYAKLEKPLTEAEIEKWV